MKCRLFILLLLFISNLVLLGQNQRFRSLSLKEGLSQSTVNCIIQDQTGLIWIGTQDGLNRYDGHEFIHFKKKYNDENSLPDNNIQALAEDSKGNIWIGTYGGGVAIYNPKNNLFKQFSTKNSALSDDIIMCFKEFNNSMFIGTKRGGLNQFIFDTDSILSVRIDDNPQVQIRDIEIFNNTLYTATSDGGVYYLQKSIWVKLLNNIQIQTIKKINNNLFLGGVNGELFINSADYFIFNKIIIDDLKDVGIWGISRDEKNNLWVGTFGAGLFKIDLSNFSVLGIYKNNTDDFNSISHDVILSVFTDKDNGIWAGTLGGGINYFEPSNQKFIHYNDLNGMNNNVVMSFLDLNDKILIGTYGGGINIYNKNDNKFSELNSVSSKIVRCIFKDTDGDIWIGTYGDGLLKFDITKNKVIQVLKGVTNDVWSIVEFNNDLWIGTWGDGLIKLNKKTGKHQQFLSTGSKNEISENTVLSLAKTKNNNLWIGTYGSGLNFLDTKQETFEHFGFNGKNKLETNNKKIRSIYIDKNDDLWIGTDGGGMNHYNNEKEEFSYITTEHNLPNNVVYSIVEDNNENLWLTTNYGLSKYSKKNQNISNFDYDDGLQNNEFNQGALCFTGDKIYAGGINGFNIFNPNDINPSQKSTFTILTSMKVMGKEFNPPIRFLDSINLDYTSNFLSFQFSYIDYSGKVQYRCKLEGFNDDWVYLDQRNFMNYTNIPPGNYTLKFQGKRMGEWNDKYSSLKINIPPPFWKTSWFYIISILLLCSGLYLFYKLKQRALLIKNNELESIVKERTNEIALKNKSLEEQKRQVEIQKEITELKHYEIQSSITYARRIQSAILPSNNTIKKYLPESFILYKPKDIVAGDFYWLETIESNELGVMSGENPTPNTQHSTTVLIAAADCTGHGVPGAMVSVICNNALNRSVRELSLTAPGEILNKTREIVIAEFEKSEEEVKDGMDIALCSLSFKTQTTNNKKQTTALLQYAGANNPLWIITPCQSELVEDANKGEISIVRQAQETTPTLLEIKANKQPIGSFRSSNNFTTHELELQKGDVVYIFSDGYVDQFGGANGKKFKAKAFKQLLLSIYQNTMDEQKTLLDNAFEKWKGNLEQIDDVCVIGFRV